MLLAGSLRDVVTIQAPMTVHDPNWGPSEGQAFENVGTARASVIASGGSESVKDKGVQASVKYTVRMRYREDVTSANRLAWSGKVLDIVSVVNVEQRNRELVLECVLHEEQG